MRKYIKMLIISLQKTFTYRKNYIISSLINIVSILILIFLWQSIYMINDVIKAYDLPSMILYLLIVNTVFGVVDTGEISKKVSDGIRHGKLSIYLIRPFNHFFSLLAEICGTKLTRIPIILILNSIFGVFLWLYSGYGGEVNISISLNSTLFFTLFVVLSFLWNYIFDYLLGLLGFWIENPWIVFFIKGKVVTLVCGLLVPIDLFPGIIQDILKYLPFKYYVFFPYKVLTSNLALNEILINLIFFCGWIIGLAFLAKYTWKKSISRYTAVGG